MTKRLPGLFPHAKLGQPLTSGDAVCRDLHGRLDRLRAARGG